MGADPFSQSKLSFAKIGEILNNLITQDINKNQNRQVLQEIGLLDEYSYIRSDKASNEVIYYSKNHKIVEFYVSSLKLHLNFLEWNKYLFDFNDEDLDSMEQFNKKVESFKKKALSKRFFQNNIKKYLFKDKALNKLLNYGIPTNFRFFIWDIVLGENYNNHKYFNYDQELNEYKIILSKKGNNPQIEKDLNRTFMKETEQTPKNIQKLRNLLNCINIYNSSGYCQGMNFIVGYLLKLTNFDEIKTFYIFKCILFDIKGYFEDGFPLLKKNNNSFTKYFKELYPKLYKHFQKYDIVNEFWVGKWLQTLFTLSLPLEELNIIWDVLLIRGFDFIIYICLALVDFIEKDLLEIKESSEIVSYLEKYLNMKGEGLIPVNKRFVDANNNFIIPLNEVLSKAYDLEKKGVGGNEKRPYYIGRKSDNQLIKFHSINLKNLNNIDNNKNGIFSQGSNDASDNINNKNIVNNNKNMINNKNLSSSLNVTNFQQRQNPFNNQNPNLNFQNNINNFNNNNNIHNGKIPFYSTKNLEVYNFGDFGNKSLNASSHSAMNFGGQYQYFNQNPNNPNMINNNYMMHYP